MIKIIDKKTLEKMIESQETFYIRFHGAVCSVAIDNYPDGLKASEEHGKEIRFFDIEIDENKLGEEDGDKVFAIKLSPTYMIYKKGVAIGRKDNFVSFDELIKPLRSQKL